MCNSYVTREDRGRHTQTHFFLFNMYCGDVFNLQSEDVSSKLEHLRDRTFKLGSSWSRRRTEGLGRCADCRGEQRGWALRWKLEVYQFVFLLTLAYDLELWAVGRRSKRLKTSLENGWDSTLESFRLWNLNIHGCFGVELQLLGVKRCQFRWFGNVICISFWTLPLRDRKIERADQKPRGRRMAWWRDYRGGGQGPVKGPSGAAWWEGGLGHPAKLLPPQPNRALSRIPGYMYCSCCLDFLARFKSFLWFEPLQRANSDRCGEKSPCSPAEPRTLCEMKKTLLSLLTGSWIHLGISTLCRH